MGHTSCETVTNFQYSSNWNSVVHIWAYRAAFYKHFPIPQSPHHGGVEDIGNSSPFVPLWLSMFPIPPPPGSNPIVWRRDVCAVCQAEPPATYHPGSNVARGWPCSLYTHFCLEVSIKGQEQNTLTTACHMYTVKNKTMVNATDNFNISRSSLYY